MSQLTTALASIDHVIQSGPFSTDWASLATTRVPRWYEDGKFGIFIHWGVYSVPAFKSEWYPRMMYQQGSAEFTHHVKTYGPHSSFGYKDFIPQFTAEHFNATAWAELFRDSGAKFVVPVAEHHDGFPMYDCSFTRWNAVQMGPKRDIIAELSAAVRKEGLVLGLSSHRAEHTWFFDGGLKFPCDVTDPAYADFYGPTLAGVTDQHDRVNNPPSKEFLDDWLARTCELVDKYHPQLVWFDWWIVHLAFKPYLQRFAAYYYNRASEWDRSVAINYKYDAMAVGSAVYDIERAQLQGIDQRFWQCDTAVAKNSWGYTNAQDYKEPRDLVHDLVDTVAKNGALLLNVGPRADGSIPEGDTRLLLAIGRWLACNGESIYGTRPWTVYGEGPASVPPATAGISIAGLPPVPAGASYDHLRAPFTAADIRFTTIGENLYATVLGWPTDGQVLIRSLASHLTLRLAPITEVTLLGYGPVAWRSALDGLHIDMPENQTGEYAWVFKIS
jgi:alpha-L-fucosidase